MKTMFNSTSPHSLQKLALYIHWPFCSAKCPYCDFNSYVAKSVDENAFFDAFKRELTAARKLVAIPQLSSIFFGGGTPSLMSTHLVADLLDYVAKLWHLPSDIEITLEANPTSLEAERFGAYSAAGINRVSIGIQSLRDEELRFLGRTHNAQQALKALEQARKAFPRVSADFIYTLPDQSLKQWQTQLDEILSLQLNHLSLYQLTIEDGTRFAVDHTSGKWVMPSNERSADFYLATERAVQAAGLICYEVSNYARTPHDVSQHNLSYWLYNGYIGVGPGAHGRLPLAGGGMVATQAFKQPQQWLERVHTPSGMSVESFEHLTPEVCAQELVMMGLRTRQGVDLRRMEAQYGCFIASEVVDALSQEGYLHLEDGCLCVSLKGRLVLNRIAQHLCDALTAKASTSLECAGCL